MIELTADSIIDYQVCSLYYEYKYVQEKKGVLELESRIQKRFNEKMKQVFYYFFYKKQSGNTPSYDVLLNKWQKLWYPENTDYSDIILEQHSAIKDSIHKYSLKAAPAILALYENFFESDMLPVSIKQQYTVPISKTTKLSGVYDLIMYRDKKFYIINFFSKFHRNNVLYTNHLICNYYAYLYQFNNDPSKLDFLVGYYDILDNSPQVIYLDLNQSDIEYLQFWCGEIESSNIYPPKRGLTKYCNKCPYDKPCSKWNSWSNSEELAKL